jgi:hypothetical protein
MLVLESHFWVATVGKVGGDGFAREYIASTKR